MLFSATTSTIIRRTVECTTWTIPTATTANVCRWSIIDTNVATGASTATAECWTGLLQKSTLLIYAYCLAWSVATSTTTWTVSAATATTVNWYANANKVSTAAADKFVLYILKYFNNYELQHRIMLPRCHHARRLHRRCENCVA
jgi:hypothetical protein